MMTASTETTLLSGKDRLPSETGTGSPVGVQMTSAEMTLIRRVQNGESDAFFDLVRPYERAVFLAALSLVKNDADAEDVAQEAILKAFKNLARFRQEAKFSTWLIQITINEAKMRVRKDRRHLHESIEEGMLGDDDGYIPRDFADWREIPSEALEQKELRKALTEGLDSLPEKISYGLDLAGRAASQHQRNSQDPQCVGSQREDSAEPRPPSDARRVSAWF